MTPNYAINATPEQALRSNRAILPARVNAALDLALAEQGGGGSQLSLSGALSGNRFEGDMRYIDVAWSHDAVDQPIRLISELDKNAYELRKIEFFRSGIVGFAGNGQTSNGTRLGELPVPSLVEINKDVQFKGTEIDSKAFGEMWHLYVASQI